jgi:hypothetical protein
MDDDTATMIEIIKEMERSRPASQRHDWSKTRPY